MEGTDMVPYLFTFLRVYKLPLRQHFFRGPFFKGEDRRGGWGVAGNYPYHLPGTGTDFKETIRIWFKMLP
jgi:hypothetical protein